jgi:hypothetical protein
MNVKQLKELQIAGEIGVFGENYPKCHVVHYTF